MPGAGCMLLPSDLIGSSDCGMEDFTLKNMPQLVSQLSVAKSYFRFRVLNESVMKKRITPNHFKERDGHSGALNTATPQKKNNK